MQRGHVQITLLAGLKHLLGDAVSEVELVVLEGGNNARPGCYDLISFFAAGAQSMPTSGFQRDLANHDVGIDHVHQLNYGIH